MGPKFKTRDLTSSPILAKASLPVKSGEVIPHLGSPGLLLIIPLNLNRQVSKDRILRHHHNQGLPLLAHPDVYSAR